MTRQTLQERGIAAAQAYIERIGMHVNDNLPTTTTAFAAVDGDVSVYVYVKATQKPDSKEPTLFPLSHLRTAKRMGFERLDVIRLHVLTEDRALLRHHRAVRDLASEYTPDVH